MNLSQRAFDELLKLTPARFKFLIYVTYNLESEPDFSDEGCNKSNYFFILSSIRVSLDTNLNKQGLSSIVDWLIEARYISEDIFYEGIGRKFYLTYLKKCGY
jgi:hypothetical protein